MLFYVIEVCPWLLSLPGDQVLADDRVQGPALVGPSHLLPHGSHEALQSGGDQGHDGHKEDDSHLGVEEAGEPEDLWSTVEAPVLELAIPL